MKKCPFCAEEIQDEAIKCRFCGEFLTEQSEDGTGQARSFNDESKINDKDELYEKAVKIVLETRQPSVAMLQKKLKTGYSCAARLIDRMEEEGILGPQNGAEPRDLLMSLEEYKAHGASINHDNNAQRFNRQSQEVSPKDCFPLGDNSTTPDNNSNRNGQVPKGSVFDTDIYKEYSEKYKNKNLPNLSAADKDRIASLLAEPCAVPYEEERTVEAWLLRISLWGKITITWKNPEDGINKTISTDKFVDHIDNQRLNKLYGKWTIEEAKINRIRFFRKFWSIYDKEVTEELIVDIDLRPDLKEKLRRARKL